MPGGCLIWRFMRIKGGFMAKHTPEEWAKACDRAEAVMQEAEQKAQPWPMARPPEVAVMDLLVVMFGPELLKMSVRGE